MKRCCRPGGVPNPQLLRSSAVGTRRRASRAADHPLRLSLPHGLSVVESVVSRETGAHGMKALSAARSVCHAMFHVERHRGPAVDLLGSIGRDAPAPGTGGMPRPKHLRQGMDRASSLLTCAPSRGTRSRMACSGFRIQFHVDPNVWQRWSTSRHPTFSAFPAIPRAPLVFHRLPAGPMP